jgi:hypothetical protein
MSSANLLRLIAAVMLALTFTRTASDLVPEAENSTALVVPEIASIRPAPWLQIISKGNSLALTASKTEQSVRGEMPKLVPAVVGPMPTRLEQSKAAVFVTISRLDRMANGRRACTIVGNDGARCSKEGISPLHQTPKREEVQKKILTVSVIYDTKAVEKKLPRQREQTKTVSKKTAKRAVKEGASARKNNIRAKGEKRVSPLVVAVEAIKLKSGKIRKKLPLQLAKARTVLQKKLALGGAQKNNRLW